MNQNRSKCFVLLHGAWYGAWCWDKVSSLLKDSGFQVIEINLPNYQGAEKNREISLNDYVNIVYHKVSGLPNKSVILVGHSMSGIVLSAFAEKYPDKIDRLVYISAFMLDNQQSIWDFISQRKHNNIGAVKSLQKISGKNGAQFSVLKIDRSTIVERFCADCKHINLQKFHSITPFKPIQTPLQLGKNYENVPKFYIKCLNDRAIAPEEQDNMIQKAKLKKNHIFYIKSSHSPFLSYPNELSFALKKIAEFDI